MPGASSSALAKHSLFATPSSASPSAADPAPPRTGVRYPEFDASPIDDSAWRPRPPQPPAPAPAPAPADAAAAALDGLVVPVPSAVALGPQELEVNHVQPLPGAPPPGASCNHAAPPAPTDSGPKELRKKDALQEVHVSVEVMEQFLRYAISNTRQGIESCGILAGKLQPSGQGDGHDIFTINTLIIPKQKGSSDMVEMLNEEEVFELQFARELYPLGWIHTHPTQSCFLSSVDVHTQCGFQIMLQEAVAIVMAPTDQQRRCGIFRLTVPGGMELIQRCPLKGFHAHPPTSTGQEIYELSGHVYLNETIPFEVVDLR